MSPYKKISTFIITLFFCVNIHGQTDTVLCNIFYGLDLGLPNSEIANKLEHGSKILKPKEITTYKWFADTIFFDYYGTLLNDGVIEIKSDSAKIFLSDGNTSLAMCADCIYDRTISVHYTSYPTSLEYYYHSEDSLEEAYNRFLKYLTLNGKKIEEITYYDAKPDKKVVFMNPHFVDDKTLAEINGRFHLIHWPEMRIKKKIKDRTFYLEIEFERDIVR